MKFYLIVSTALLLAACNNSQNAADVAKQGIRDSVNDVNMANEVRQRTIDSMEATKHSSAASSNSTPTENSSSAVSSESPKKKGMSKTTKGALIGAGAGIIGGAVTGAAVSKDKGKGAVVGGIIGGAVGSGVGYGAGAKKDNKGK
jgi:hypothetical protein